MKGVRKDMQQVQEVITRLAWGGNHSAIYAGDITIDVDDICLEVDYLSYRDVKDALESLQDAGSIQLDATGDVIVSR
jgi:hypothetical protein